MKVTPAMKRRTFCTSALTGAAVGALPFERLFAATEIRPATAIPAISRLGKELLLTSRQVMDLRGALRGPLLLAGSDGYDGARRIWNGAFDKRPAMIARCAGAADVTECVHFARAHDLLVAVRGGGHSLPGHSTCDGGLVIDLSGMRSVRVDPVARIAYVEPGVLLGELDREAQAFELAVPAGTVSHTGVAGLTLGGGIGRLARKYGLSSDNVMSVDVVTANGSLVRANAEENPELFWGVRGGGGNFGVVTAFQFRLHPLGRIVTGGDLIYRPESARDVLGFIADYAARAPDEMWVEAVLERNADGARHLLVMVCHCGASSSAEHELRAFRKLRPLRDSVRAQPYIAVQASKDEASPHGRGYYMTGGILSHIEQDLIDASIAGLERPEADLCKIYFTHIGGAIARMPADSTAYAHRTALHTTGVRASWDDRAQAQAKLRWGRETWKRLEPFTAGYYANLSAGASSGKARVYYGTNYERLVALKTAVDPLNLFHLNPNIEPRVAA
jgi:FAD/FMN-containing dehydrogenase